MDIRNFFHDMDVIFLFGFKSMESDSRLGGNQVSLFLGFKRKGYFLAQVTPVLIFGEQASTRR